MKRVFEELTQASHKLAEAMYAKASQRTAGGGDAHPGDGAAASGGQAGGSKEDVVDADFEEVKG